MIIWFSVMILLLSMVNVVAAEWNYQRSKQNIEECRRLLEDVDRRLN
jgi:hypothetical protein